MEQEHLQEEVNEEITNNKLSALKQVTPLSKYLAMALFIILPFLGGWVGYSYAPEKIIEVEKIVGVEKEIIESDTTNTKELLYFKDEEVGVSFSYPARWGPVLIIDNKIPIQKYNDLNNEYIVFNCDSEYKNDPCNFRTFLFKFVRDAGGMGPSIFMTAETIGDFENPIGRGGFWGDFAGNIDSNYVIDCENDSACKLITNKNGIVFAHYSADSPPEEMGYKPERYYLYNSNSPYNGLVLSPVRVDTELNGKSVEPDDFSIIIDSFKFIEH